MRYLALPLLVSLCAHAQEIPGRTLLWADEFTQADGLPPDAGKWGYNTGNGDNGWGNNELQYHTDRTENARIENGSLVIEARAEAFRGRNHTSGRSAGWRKLGVQRAPIFDSECRRGRELAGQSG